MSDRQRHGFVLLLVVGLIAASIVVLTTQKTVLGLDLKGGIELVYQGEPTPADPGRHPGALNRAVDIMRSRVDQLGVSEPSIQTTGNSLITVGLPDVHDVARAENEVGQTAQLFFYDWEANVLTPNGKTVAESAPHPGSDRADDEPGGRDGSRHARAPGGCRSTRRSSSPPSSHRRRWSRPSRARDRRTTSSGPRAAPPARPSPRPPGRRRCRASTACSTARTRAPTDLYSGLPAGGDQGRRRARHRARRARSCSRRPTRRRRPDQGQQPQRAVLRPQGRRRAHRRRHHQPVAEHRPDRPARRHLRLQRQGPVQLLAGDRPDRPPRRQRQPRRRRRSTSTSRWRWTTSSITVPQINYRQYPDGIIGGGGADITGGFTSQSASDLATQLRLGRAADQAQADLRGGGLGHPRRSRRCIRA